MQQQITALAALLAIGVAAADGAAAFQRPSQTLLVNFTSVHEHCEWPVYGGAKFAGTPACLAWLAANESEYMAEPWKLGLSPVDTSQPLIIHTTWRGSLHNEKLQLMIKSFLFSQVRAIPAQAAQLWIWLAGERRHRVPDPATRTYVADRGFEEELQVVLPEGLPSYMACSSLIKLKAWHAGHVMTHLPEDVWPAQVAAWLRASANATERQERLEDVFGHTSHANAVAYSDLQRFVLLGAYGGMYVDADVLLLRDLRPLQIQAFWYRWEHHGKPNTAIMYARKGDAALLGLVRLTFATALAVTEDGRITGADTSLVQFHPWEVHDAAKRAGGASRLSMFPSSVFNPFWLQGHAEEEAFGRWSLPDYARFHDVQDPAATPGAVPTFLRGAFTSHWHNRWRDKFKPGTWGAAVEEAYKMYLAGQLLNSYGEKFDWNLCVETGGQTIEMP